MRSLPGNKEAYVNRTSKEVLEKTTTDEANRNFSILGDTLRTEIKQLIKEAVREELDTPLRNGFLVELLTPEELADQLKVPVSWVYEQSRLDKIPTHRIGRYIRFDLREVLESQADAVKIGSSIRKAG